MDIGSANASFGRIWLSRLSSTPVNIQGCWRIAVWKTWSNPSPPFVFWCASSNFWSTQPFTFAQSSWEISTCPAQFLGMQIWFRASSAFSIMGSMRRASKMSPSKLWPIDSATQTKLPPLVSQSFFRWKRLSRSARAMPKHPSARTVILRCISCHVSRPGLALARLLVPMLVRAWRFPRNLPAKNRSSKIHKIPQKLAKLAEQCCLSNVVWCLAESTAAKLSCSKCWSPSLCYTIMIGCCNLSIL